MPLVLNVHTPSHSFALPHKDGENFETLLNRILTKAGAQQSDRTAFKEALQSGKAGLKYEFESGRWSLEDDDDLKILFDRYPVESTPSITLHLTPPPSWNSNGTVSNTSANSLYQTDLAPSLPAFGQSTAAGSEKAKYARSVRSTKSTKSRSAGVNGHLGGAILDRKANGNASTLTPDHPEFESLGDKHRKQWQAFHDGNGVRTVVGDFAGVKNVRMLLKPGYRHVYVSRPFALKNGLIPAKAGLGNSGYVGLVNLGQFPITVGNKTVKHTVMLSEEAHFDVVLGRSWAEKCHIKTDPVDITSVIYMDTGDKVDCDIVVLKGSQGEIVTVT